MLAGSTHKDMANVGYLTVKLIQAINLPSKKFGNMDPFVVIEIENCRFPLAYNCIFTRV